MRRQQRRERQQPSPRKATASPFPSLLYLCRYLARALTRIMGAALMLLGAAATQIWCIAAQLQPAMALLLLLLKVEGRLHCCYLLVGQSVKK